MRKAHLFLLLAGLYVGFSSSGAWACRYNVLEVGFIDSGLEPYQLWGYVPAEMSPEAVSAWCDRIELALMEANIRFEWICPERDSDHPAVEYLQTHEITDLPAGMLVSPDGQSLPMPLSDPNVSLENALDSVLVSSTRAEILRKTSTSYGVVLLIEGPDEAPNRQALEAAQTAVTRIDARLEFMPKPIARGPEVVKLAAESVAGEKVLLWSLGLSPADINEPCAAVFYGRGRWIGPLFRGPQITAERLTQILYVIGADCECGLDHRWLQGTMLPARWDEGLHAAAAKTLGFDPESPMVRMEMLSILRRGLGGTSSTEIPFGYREIEVVTEPAGVVDQTIEPVEPTVHDTVPAIPESVTVVAPEAARPHPTNDIVGVTAPFPAMVLGLVGVLACVAVIAGIFLRRSGKV